MSTFSQWCVQGLLRRLFDSEFLFVEQVAAGKALHEQILHPSLTASKA
jgi:hypothetical protein